MKNIRLKLLAILSLLSLQTQIFCADDILTTLYNIRTDMNADFAGVNTKIDLTNEILSKAFVDNNNFIKDSIKEALKDSLGSKTSNIPDLSQNIEDLTKTDELLQGDTDLKEETKPLYNNSVKNLLSITQRAYDGVKKLLKQEIFYITNKNIVDKNADNAALLIVDNVEGGSNDITTLEDDDIVLGVKKKDTKKADATASLSKNLGVKNPETSILSANSLLGYDGYKLDSDEDKNARLFITQLLNSTPTPTTFSIPPTGEAKMEDRNNVVTIYLPRATTNKPYTEIKVSTDPNSCGTTNSKNGSCIEYDEMIKKLNLNNTYQQYKLIYRTAIAQRTLFLGTILQSYQNRLRTHEDKSLIEKEKDMALFGLTKQYYDSLKDKSPGELNVEQIYILNKIVYFLQKLHQDNERIQLMMAFYEMQNQVQDNVNKNAYVNPINDFFMNKCWDVDLPVPEGGETDKEKRKKLCDPEEQQKKKDAASQQGLESSASKLSDPTKT